MIVLTLTVGDANKPGATTEVRSDRARVLLGSGPRSDVRRRDAGWHGREAVLVHAGTHVLLTRPGRPGTVTVRVGDVVHLGTAKVALVGLLPRTGAAAGAAASATVGAAAAAEVTGTPGSVLFGGYDEPVAAARAAAARATATRAAFTNAVAPQGARTETDATGRKSIYPLAWHRDTDWSEALYDTLRKSPFLALSIALHALLILTFLFLGMPDPPEKSQGHGDLVMSVGDPEPAEEPGPLLPPEPEASFPETDLPDISEIEDPSEKSPTPETQEDIPDLEAPEDALPTPLDMGITPNLSAIGARTPRRRPPQPKMDLRESFSKSEAGLANDRAAGVIRSQLGAGSDGKGRALDRLTKTDLLVVHGGFDHIGRVLDALRLPYTLVQPFSLSQPGAPDLSQHKVVFWNCGESQPRERQRLVARRLREFVAKGGYLFSTDWAIANLILPAFPGYVDTQGSRAPLPEMTVDIEPDPANAADPLLDGVFRPGVKGKWWLEQASFDIQVLKPDDVTVLIRSPDLTRHHARDGAVAFTFQHGRGRVLHVMGHYFQEEGNLAGTVAAQRLALNFILQRLAQDGL